MKNWNTGAQFRNHLRITHPCPTQSQVVTIEARSVPTTCSSESRSPFRRRRRQCRQLRRRQRGRPTPTFVSEAIGRWDEADCGQDFVSILSISKPVVGNIIVFLSIFPNLSGVWLGWSNLARNSWIARWKSVFTNQFQIHTLEHQLESSRKSPLEVHFA